jgi:hypothetical protein
MHAMFVTYLLRKAALGAVLLGGFACATTPGLPGDSIEATTGKRTGNPFEINLTASGAKLKAAIVNRGALDQQLLHDPNLQASTLEIISATGSPHKPYDSRLIKKFDTTPYCQLFQRLSRGKKLELGTARFQKSRDGYTGQWGPFNFDEVPPGDYLVRVVWNSDRTQCFDESTRQMRKLPSLWRGVVRSNQVTLRLR